MKLAPLWDERHSHEHHVRVHAGVDVAQVGVGNMMIHVAKVDAVVPGGEHLHARPKLGGEVELSGAEHLPVEIEEATAAGEEWLDAAGVKKIDLCADGAPASGVRIHALAVRLWSANHRQWDDLGYVA